ncbi:MAG: hypothetical protein ACI4ML_12295 [Aristaeellaceae bacterium]
MMKKILAIVCLLCLLAGAIPAGAEELSPVYVLMSITPSGEQTPLGTAVLVGDSSTLVTTRWAAMATSGLYAVGSGGTLAIARASVPASGSDLVTLTLREPSPAQPVQLGETDDSMTCVGLRRGETRTESCGVEAVTLTVYEQTACMLYTGLETMLPGAALFNSQGQLAGLTMAGYGEGLNRYVAYPADVLQARLSGEGPAEQADAQQQALWLTGLEVTADQGEMMARWDHLDEPEQAEGSMLYLIWQDTGNDFVSYAEVAWADGYATFPCVPGHSYLVWLQQSLTGEVELASLAARNAHLAEAAQTGPFTDYGFHDEIMYLTSLPEDHGYGETEQIPPLGDFTAAGLAAEGLCCYLQAVSVYEVAEEQLATMVIAMQAPDGNVYAELAGFIFMPELNGNDTWRADVTGLVRDCMTYSGDLPGEYTLSYYLDGQLASSFAFTLE